jgi:hypothetical protein
MRASLLATPGKLRNAQAVRRDLAWLISQAEIAVAKGQNPERAFTDIRAFLASAVSYVNTAAPVYSITAPASPTSIVANNTAVSTITANVKANGINSVGQTVTFTKSGAQAATCTLSAASGVTDASGNIAVTLKGTVAGTCTVTATCQGKSVNTVVTLT